MTALLAVLTGFLVAGVILFLMWGATAIGSLWRMNARPEDDGPARPWLSEAGR